MGEFPLHMAMAALAGASVAAFSSYYLHCRALAQLLEFALDVERRRGGGETGSSSGGIRQLNLRKEKQRRGAAIPVRRRRKFAGKRGSVGEGSNGVVDEKDGDIVRKERDLSRIESLPGGTYESAHALSDFSPD